MCLPVPFSAAGLCGVSVGFHRSNNRDRVDLLTAVVNKNEPDDGIRERVLWALQCFDICTANRNVLMHARSELEHRSSTMRLERQERLPWNKGVPCVRLRRIFQTQTELYWTRVNLTLA